MFSTTHLELDDFLPVADAERVLRWALDNEGSFVPTRIGKDTVDETFRTSRATTDFDLCRKLVRDAIKPCLPAFSQALGLASELARFDAEFVAHNDGAFFKTHVDTGPRGEVTHTRAISLVYYVNREPRGFEGGELRVFRINPPAGAERYIDVRPRHNLLAVFPAMVPHEVRPVRCASMAFEDSRLAINFWAHRPGVEPA